MHPCAGATGGPPNRFSLAVATGWYVCLDPMQNPIVFPQLFVRADNPHKPKPQIFNDSQAVLLAPIRVYYRLLQLCPFDMRLLNVGSFSFELFPDSDTPTYAILSHTWGAEEVTLEDLKCLPPTELREREGYRKLTFARCQAIRDSYTYLWVDTCCIDRSSSAELSEAINSMFEWYRNAAVCYAYLSDLAPDNLEKAPYSQPLEHSLSQSRWFTRGWTLQELIAPANVEFFGYPWTPLGSREKLSSTISCITGIPQAVFLDRRLTERYSVAQRMSWMANRETTRPEDMAYSLLGMFNVNMPLLYGEGKRAFVRLQHQIMKQSTDLTLFAWDRTEVAEFHTGSVLSDHPQAFISCGKVVTDSGRMGEIHGIGYGTLRMRLPILTPPASWAIWSGIHTIAILPCHSIDNPDRVLGIPLTRLDMGSPCKRVCGGKYGLVNIAPNLAERAKFQTTELDIQVELSRVPMKNEYFEYYGRMMMCGLLWDDYSRLAGDGLQDLWDCVTKKSTNDFRTLDDASIFSSSSLAVYASELEYLDWTRTLFHGTDSSEMHQCIDWLNVQPRELGRLDIFSLARIASNETVIMAPTQQDLQNESNLNHRENLCLLNRAPRAVGDEAIPIPNIQDKNTGALQKSSEDDSTSERSWSKPKSTNGNHRVLGFTDDAKMLRDVEQNAGSERRDDDDECQDEEDEEEEDHSEEEGEDDDNEDDDEGFDDEDDEDEIVEAVNEEAYDFQSLSSDSDSDETSSITSFVSKTIEETSVLDILVDVLVDIITERSDIVSKIVHGSNSEGIEAYLTDQTELSSEMANSTGQGRKRKADVDGGDGRRGHDSKLNKVAS
jgi:hypothetical protein